MTRKEALRQGVLQLKEADSDTPYLDAAVLLSEALHISKEQLYVSLPDQIDDAPLSRFREFIRNRQAGNPVSYIIGRKEFFGLEFTVDKRVLVPRPDTEVLVEAVMDKIKAMEKPPDVLDICTGTGCIPIALKYYLPYIQVFASDISAEVEDVYNENALRHLAAIPPFFVSNLFDNIPKKFDIITANPPYLNSEEIRNMRFINWPEPEIALDGGDDGLNLYRLIIKKAPEKLRKNGFLVMEGAYWQLKPLKELMKQAGYSDIVIREDLGGRDRVIIGTTPIS